MTSFVFQSGLLPRCTARGDYVRLSSVGMCITPIRSALVQCPRKLQNHRTCSVTPLAALAAGDAFRQYPSLGATVRRQIQQLQKALFSPHDKEIIEVAFPCFVGLALEPVVNAFNAGMVGHLGTHQLSAVSLGSIVLNSFIFLFSFLLFLTVPEIAAAVVKKDDDEVSQVATQSLWVALGCGLLTAVVVGLGAPTFVAALNPPEPAVAAHATQYIQIRAMAIPASLIGFVATAVFRGFKDTRTPLLGTGASVAMSGCLHLLLLNVLHLDVAGAAIATALASYSSSSVMMAVLLRRGKLQLRHLVQPPPLSAVLPILQRGVVLAARSMVSFGMVLFASTLCVRMGSAFQASFEVLRQIWMMTMPFFECLNVATQSLCASALGVQDRATASTLLSRLLTLNVVIGAMVGVAVWLLQGPLIAYFTRDPEVVTHVLMALPLVCIFFPVDAAGSIMDGSLLAAKQSSYMSAVQIAGAAVQYVLLMSIARTGKVDSFSIWAAIKVIALARLLGGIVGVFMSRHSAYLPLQPPVTATTDDSSSSSSSTIPAGSPPTSTCNATSEGTVLETSDALKNAVLGVTGGVTTSLMATSSGNPG